MPNYPSYRYHQKDKTSRPVIVKNEAQDVALGEEWGELPWSDPLLAQVAQEPSILPMARPGVLQPGEVSEVAPDQPLPSGRPQLADPALTGNMVRTLPPPPGPAQPPVTAPKALAVGTKPKK